MIIQYRGEIFNPDFTYELGFDVDHALLVKGKKKVLYVGKLNLSLAEELAKGRDVEVREWKGLSFLKGKKVGLSYAYHSAAFLEKLRSTAHLRDVSPLYRRRRRRKSPREVFLLRKWERESLAVLRTLSAEVERGMKEKEVEALLRCLTAERGEEAFHPIVAGDRRARHPHYKASRASFKELLLLDFGVGGLYKSDITDVLTFSPRWKKAREEVVDLFFSLIDWINDQGPVTMASLQKRAEKEVAERGWHMPHAVGHGIGLEVHESPFAKERVFLRDTVIALEPAFYNSRGGVRVERLVAFNPKGRARLLNPKGLE